MKVMISIFHSRGITFTALCFVPAAPSILTRVSLLQVMCFYFVFTIFSTVGFGDIFATNTSERVRFIKLECELAKLAAFVCLPAITARKARSLWIALMLLFGDCYLQTYHFTREDFVTWITCGFLCFLHRDIFTFFFMCTFALVH